MTKCPDCRDEELDMIYQSVVERVDGRPVYYENNHYKCYGCNQEFNPEDLEE